MKVLVAYMSQTGNTQKVAEAIFSEITGEKEIEKLEEVASLDGYDLAFVGFPIHAFGPAEPAKQFLLSRCAGKAVALFITHAAAEDGEGTQAWVNACLECAAQAEVLGSFDCQGELSAEIAEFLIKSDDPNLQAFGKQRDATLGQPDASRLEKARQFAREIMLKAG